MEQKNAFPKALRADAMPYFPQQITSLNNPSVRQFAISGASMEANNYNQLSRGMPYAPNYNMHHPNFAMQIGQSEFMNNSQNNVFYPSNFPPVMMLPKQQAYYPCKVHDQEFDYFVVIDFQATCDKETNPYPQEIIEFSSVLVNSATGQLEASFQAYLRPAHHQQLTDFCKELTGIQQIQVDRGVLLSEAISWHDKLLEDKGIKHKKFAVVTWSDRDCCVMLESECTFKGIAKPPYFNRWIDLRVSFQQRFGGTRYNLQESVQVAGLTWEGRAHCGLDDARNTARLLLLFMQQGTKFSITNSLMFSDQNQQQTRKEPSAGHDHVQFHHPAVDPVGEQRCNYCFCGVQSNKCIVRKPGPNQGRSFFGCGNWRPATRAACKYFVWASP